MTRLLMLSVALMGAMAHGCSLVALALLAPDVRPNLYASRDLTILGMLGVVFLFAAWWCVLRIAATDRRPS